MPNANHTGFLLSRIRLFLSVATLPFRHGRPGARKLGEFITIWRSGEFDPHWYLEQHSNVRIAGGHPLQHFVLHGDDALANPNPTFDTQRYKHERFVQWRDHNAFAHYLRNRDKSSYQLPAGVARYPQLKIVVVAWDLGHNPAGRALLLAQVLGRRHKVELWGAQFPRFGSELWEPIRALKNVTVKSWPGSDLPNYCAEMIAQVNSLDCDLLYISKARLPSMALGVLAKQLRNIPIIVDVDDYEPAFFKDITQCTIDQAIEATRNKNTLNPHDGEWTLASEQLLDAAEHVTVSNTALQQKFGGTVVPHLRDETIFKPDEKLRSRYRRKLGYQTTDRVILFIGTPRMHKGLRTVIDALTHIEQHEHRTDIHLLVIGSPADAEASAFFNNNTSRNIKRLDNISFSDLPAYLNIGDLVCLMQTVDSVVSQYQLPAKLIDALAMGIPVLVNDTPPLRSYINSGMVTLTNPEQLPRAITHVFDHYAAYRQRALKNREWFVKECSFHAFEAAFEQILEGALNNQASLSSPAKQLVDYCLGNSGHELEQGVCPSPTQKYNIVYFWKQNDSGIYGRRQDMLVKYLLKDKRVSRIVHFDLPMTETQFNTLQTQAASGEKDQSTLVSQNTVERRAGRISHSGRLHEYVFVHQQTEENIYRYIYDYARYIERALDSSKAFETGTKTLFILCPRVPEFPYLLKRFRPHLVLSDIIDNHLKWKQKRWPREDLEEHYRSVLAASDIVITNNADNQTDMRQWASDIALIPNAGEAFTAEDLLGFKKPAELVALGQKTIIGYSGNLDSQRIDIDLLDELIVLKPECQFVFIGSTHQSKEALILNKHANAHFFGAKPYREALSYIAHFDAAIVPHKDTELTRIMDPLKLYVYLSVGVPIVSTPVAVNEVLANRIHFANNAETFNQSLDACLTAAGNSQIRSSLLAYDECWPARVSTLLNLVDSKFEHPLAGKAQKAIAEPTREAH